jgi:hypothetical protein
MGKCTFGRSSKSVAFRHGPNLLSKCVQAEQWVVIPADRSLDIVSGGIYLIGSVISDFL